MVHLKYLKSNWGIFSATLFVLMAFFTACTQGQGPTDTPDKVTVSGTAPGTEAPTQSVPAEDVCAKPENLDNVLCKWVATELSASAPSELKNQMAYDNQGRVIQVTEFKADGKKDEVRNITYDAYGEWEVEVLSSPDPAEPEKFTSRRTKTTMRNPQDGSIVSVSEVKEILNGTQWTPNSAKMTTYHYPSPTQLILTAKGYHGSSTTPTGAQTYDVTKDSNGKWVSVDQREGGWDDATSTVIPLNAWIKHSYEYWPSGRLKKWEKRRQDCGSVSCNTQGSHTATEIETWGVTEGPDHATGIFRTGDGGYGFMPDGTIDSNYDCEASYELQGQIAKHHPFNMLGLMGDDHFVEMGFTDRDLFSSLICRVTMAGQSGQQQTLTVKWVRLWEALPGGTPPGSP